MQRALQSIVAAHARGDGGPAGPWGTPEGMHTSMHIGQDADHNRGEWASCAVTAKAPQRAPSVPTGSIPRGPYARTWAWGWLRGGSNRAYRAAAVALAIGTTDKRQVLSGLGHRPSRAHNHFLVGNN